MPGLNLDQNLLSADTDFSASDWAEGGASASLDFRGALELDRGVDLEIGIGAMAQLNLAFQKFLAADADVRAQASARLKGQIQLPMDVFGEAGVAVRLQAVAEAAVMARLGIGLSIKDFIALAEQDPRIDPVALQLLIVLLEEVKIEAGVSGKAAFSAMAYANLAITARLIDDNVNGIKAGFTVGGGYGVGFEGGYGFAVFAELGLYEPRRYIKRTIDVMVDSVFENISLELDDESTREMVSIMRYPVKMAFRGSFELGMALAEASPTFTGDGKELAQQVVHVILEEAQRALLEELSELSLKRFNKGLGEIGASDSKWAGSLAQRTTFSNKLKARPTEPYDLSSQNTRYWGELVSSGIKVGNALDNDPVSGAVWLEPISVLWAATHLLLISAQKITSASARVSALGMVSTSARAAPFEGPLPPDMTPPSKVQEHINSALQRPISSVLTQDDLVSFLVQDAVLNTLVSDVPHIRSLLSIVQGGAGDSFVDAAKIILNNIGAFSRETETGRVDAQDSLKELTQGLRAFLDVQIKQELLPLVHEATQNDPVARMYFDEVMLPSMEFAVGTGFQTVIDWEAGGIGYRDALREACSSIVIKLFGRSLVVTTDVLSAFAMQQMSTEIRKFSGHVNDPNGIAETLSDLISTDRAFVAEVLEETLDICADVFTPLPEDKRATIRDILYDLIDNVPATPDGNWLDQLKQDVAFPSAENQKRLMQLSEELGVQALEYFTRFFNKVLLKIAEVMADKILELLSPVRGQIDEWNAEMKDFARHILDSIIELPKQIDQTTKQANTQYAQSLDPLETIINNLGNQSQAEFRDAIAEPVFSSAIAALNGVPGYSVLSGSQRSHVRNVVEDSVKVLFTPHASVLHPIITLASEPIEHVFKEIVEALDELRQADPNHNASEQVQTILRRSMESKIRDTFAEENPGIDLVLDLDWDITVPSIWGVTEWNHHDHWPGKSPKTWGWVEQPPIKIEFKPDLGRLELPIDSVIDMAVDMLANLPNFNSLTNDIVAALALFFKSEDQVAVLENELLGAKAQSAIATSSLEDLNATEFSVAWVQPISASIHKHDIEIDVALIGVPASYVGTGEMETQRIFISVNDQIVPNDLLDFKSRAPTSESAPDLSIDMSNLERHLNMHSETERLTQSTLFDGKQRNDRTRENQRKSIKAFSDLHSKTRRIKRQTNTYTQSNTWVSASNYDPHSRGRMTERLREKTIATESSTHSLKVTGSIPLHFFSEGFNAITVSVTNGTDALIQDSRSVIVSENTVPEKTATASNGLTSMKLPTNKLELMNRHILGIEDFKSRNPRSKTGETLASLGQVEFSRKRTGVATKSRSPLTISGKSSKSTENQRWMSLLLEQGRKKIELLKAEQQSRKYTLFAVYKTLETEARQEHINRKCVKNICEESNEAIL